MLFINLYLYINLLARFEENASLKGPTLDATSYRKQTDETYQMPITSIIFGLSDEKKICEFFGKDVFLIPMMA